MQLSVRITTEKPHLVFAFEVTKGSQSHWMHLSNYSDMEASNNEHLWNFHDPIWQKTQLHIIIICMALAFMNNCPLMVSYSTFAMLFVMKPIISNYMLTLVKSS